MVKHDLVTPLKVELLQRFSRHATEAFANLSILWLKPFN